MRLKRLRALACTATPYISPSVSNTVCVAVMKDAVSSAIVCELKYRSFVQLHKSFREKKFNLKKKMGTVLLHEELRTRLRLEARVRELEESTRDLKEENFKLKGRLDTMTSVYTETSTSSILEWASVLRAKDEEIQRLKETTAQQHQPPIMMRTDSSKASETISSLRNELDAAHARIRQLELLVPQEEVKSFESTRRMKFTLSTGHCAPQDGRRARAGNDVARRERRAPGYTERGRRAQELGQEAGGHVFLWRSTIGFRGECCSR